MTQPKYDVAISFLSADEPIAAALYSALSDGLKVFFYPRSQDDLAGKDGLEAMRTPFLDESRVAVVLYREGWGKTPWTRVEQTAIQDSCLQDGWQRLFFIMLDASVPPRWLPTHYVRLNLANYTLEQAVGAIKKRIEEVGGIISPLTPLKRAEMAQQETQYLGEKERLRSLYGRDLVTSLTKELFTKIKDLAAEINASGTTSIEFLADTHHCHLRSRASLFATLSTYSDPKLVVHEYDKKLRMGSETQLFYMEGEPRRLSENIYLPDMTRAREYGWSKKGQSSTFLSSQALADKIVSQFIDLAAKAERGKLARRAD